MVSDIPGTTRDAIEDTLNIRGIPYRFIDTAGIRHTDDALEAMGIERTFRHLENAAVVLLVTDTTASSDGILAQCQGIGRQSRQHAAVVLNKIDREDSWKSLAETLEKETGWPVIPISAKLGKNIEQLTDFLLSVTASAPRLEQVVVTNARHYEALNSACAAIDRAKTALESGLSGDLLAEDLRSVIHHIGSITSEGMITSEDVLHTIFSRFCIGK